ncbi:MAG: right-handed parallel beta-helix repeat-containing protein [Thermoplasmatota archaeon]
MNGTRGGFALSLKVLALILLLSTALSELHPSAGVADDPSEGKRSTPEGFITLETLASENPGIMTDNGNHYLVRSTLTVSSVKKLYIGAGEQVLFEEDAGLVVLGEFIVDGTETNPVVFDSASSGSLWTGLKIEGSRDAEPDIHNATIGNADIGLQSVGSNVRITGVTVANCSQSGLDLKGPLPGSGDVRIASVRVTNATFYAIKMDEIGNFEMRDSSFSLSSTGIRLYRSSGMIENCIVDSAINTGLHAVNSEVTIKETIVSTSADVNFATSYQVVATNSSLTIRDSSIRGALIGIRAVSDSELDIAGSSIGPNFKWGIQSINSSLAVLYSRVEDSEEMGLRLFRTTVSFESVDIIDNGYGFGEYLFPSLYLEGCTGKIAGGSIRGSGGSHIYAISSTLDLQQVNLGMFGRKAVELYQGSSVNFVDSEPPERKNVTYGDSVSIVKYSIHMNVVVRDFETGSYVEDCVVDVRDRDQDIIGTFETDAAGTAGPYEVLVLMNYSFNSTVFYFPLRLVAQKDGYEISFIDLSYPRKTVEMSLYPPNSPPDLTVSKPVDGDIGRDEIEIRGIISDDLGVHRLKVGLDDGFLTEYELGNVTPDGEFSIMHSLIFISSGEHDLHIYGFDGSHLSNVETRRILVQNPWMEDDDGDGLSNGLEDANLNGLVDPGETDPMNPDTDGDGLIDGVEDSNGDGKVNEGETDPLNPDSDGDFLRDGDEDVNGNGRTDENETDPLERDTDKDGIDDYNDPYPLDPTPITTSDPDDYGIWIIVLAVVFFMLLAVLIYMIYLKSVDRRGPAASETVEKGSGLSTKKTGDGGNDGKNRKKRKR